MSSYTEITRYHSELRQQAVMLAWVISRDLKNINLRGLVDSVGTWQLLAEGVEYLLSFACDDWSILEGTCKELESKVFPACFPYLDPELLIHERWQAFVRDVAEAEGVSVVATKDRLPHDERKTLIPIATKEAYAVIGLANGFLQLKKNWLKPPVTILT